MTGNASTSAMEALRDRVVELLARERRPIHTGQIALELKSTTSEVHTAMHHPLQLGQVWFVSSEGWSLPPKQRPSSANDTQACID